MTDEGEKNKPPQPVNKQEMCHAKCCTTTLLFAVPTDRLVQRPNGLLTGFVTLIHLSAVEY